MLSSFVSLCGTKDDERSGGRVLGLRARVWPNWRERQHGVVSIRQLETRLGYSRGAVQREVAAGRLHPTCTAASTPSGTGASRPRSLPGGGTRLRAPGAAEPSVGGMALGDLALRTGAPHGDRAAASQAAAADPASSLAHPHRGRSGARREDSGHRPAAHAARLRRRIPLLSPAANARAQRGAEAVRPRADRGAARAQRAPRWPAPAAPTRSRSTNPSPSPAPGSSGSSSKRSWRPGCRGRRPTSSRRGSSSTSTGRSGASRSNSTPTRPMAPTPPSSATTSATRT